MPDNFTGKISSANSYYLWGMVQDALNQYNTNHSGSQIQVSNDLIQRMCAAECQDIAQSNGQQLGNSDAMNMDNFVATGFKDGTSVTFDTDTLLQQANNFVGVTQGSGTSNSGDPSTTNTPSSTSTPANTNNSNQITTTTSNITKIHSSKGDFYGVTISKGQTYTDAVKEIYGNLDQGTLNQLAGELKAANPMPNDKAPTDSTVINVSSILNKDGTPIDYNKAASNGQFISSASATGFEDKLLGNIHDYLGNLQANNGPKGVSRGDLSAFNTAANDIQAQIDSGKALDDSNSTLQNDLSAIGIDASELGTNKAQWQLAERMLAFFGNSNKSNSVYTLSNDIDSGSGGYLCAQDFTDLLNPNNPKDYGGGMWVTGWGNNQSQVKSDSNKALDALNSALDINSLVPEGQ